MHLVAILEAIVGRSMKLKSILKWFLYVCGTLAVVVALVISFYVIRLNAKLTAEKATGYTSLGANPEETAKTSPWRKDFHNKTLLENARNKTESEADKVTKKANEQKEAQPTSRLQFINSQINLLTTDVRAVNFCQINCNELADYIERSEQYDKGLLPLPLVPENDPSYQLAAIISKTTFGPSGKDVFVLLKEISYKPASVKATISLFELLSKADVFLKYLDDIGKRKAQEADELKALLSEHAKSCTQTTWEYDCKLLEEDVVTWVKQGAFE